MSRRLVALLLLFSARLPLPAAEPPAPSFNRDIRPILSENCYHCHGPDAANRKGKRRLDTFEGASAERDGIRALVPGDPASSELLLRIASPHADEVMPPPEAHKTITAEQREKLRRWIAAGAAYEPHWAFVPLPAATALPTVNNAAWPRGAIDRFVLARLEAEGLAPSAEAPRERWLRRATFDLTGLPPTQPEIDAFLADRADGAHERVVDRLLASPRFGERMAVPWLDLARYADSYGYQADPDSGAWPYRDWVVRALNANLPWNDFITWQVAGDLLPDATRDQRLATAFNRLHRKNNEGGSVPEEFRQEGISDRVHTFGTAFLGLTLECARCHDHKYDPISARDYYSLGAFFNSIDEWGLLQNGKLKEGTIPYPALALPTPAQDAEVAVRQAAVEKLERLLREWPAAHEAEFEAWLAEAGRSPAAIAAALPDLAAHYTFDDAASAKLGNAVATAKDTAATRGPGNSATTGRLGGAVLCSGDDPIKTPLFGVAHITDPVSFSFWLRPAEPYPRAVIVSNGPLADTTYNAVELLLEDGRLRWSIIREYPGNAASVRATRRLPVGEWTHVTITYDGSARAAGLRIYLDGRPADTTVVRDGLTRDYVVGDAIEFSARNRDNGLRGGALDDLRIFTRAITAIEVAHLHDGAALPGQLASGDRPPARLAQLRDFYHSAIDPGARTLAARLRAARAALREARDQIIEVAVMEETPVPRPAHLLARGAYDAPGERVPRATPAALPPLPAGAPLDRLGLARWLTDPAHPLTARVIANRLWQEFFGRGLVATPDNFGQQGEPPSHPELLDWLARDFIAGGWDHKRACRQIVLSATYRQDSRTAAALRESDPENILLGRAPARRLTAEMLRDSALALGGILDPGLGGPPVKPYQPEGSMWRALNNFLPDYKPDTGSALHRRSIYTFWRRTTTPPNMMALDATTREVCVARRQSTSTPLQPLVLLNDPQFVEAARALGERMLREGGATPAARVAWAFREVTGRPPAAAELPALHALHARQREIFSADPAGAEKFLRVGTRPADAALPAPELAAATAVASALFNLDAGVTLR